MDDALAPANCVGWSPSSAPPPVGWACEREAEEIVQISVLLSGDIVVGADVVHVAAA